MRYHRILTPLQKARKHIAEIYVSVNSACVCSNLAFGRTEFFMTEKSIVSPQLKWRIINVQPQMLQGFITGIIMFFFCDLCSTIARQLGATK